ncbi:hypothetical protein F443_20716 [Phytophthora nicotianae P1569]|uniref:BZIP domain-containing protein n=1 Tax=Phytophthora nicotianae P1569 TaxID=1317065 RepID=V9E1S8_PHYNI|nr:hypothetical protein F443_20716 [Phytophthora nicotianae P1569]
MKSCPINPPNSLSLSDTVIGTIVERSEWKSRCNPFGPVAHTTHNEMRNDNVYQKQPSSHKFRYAPCSKPLQGYTSGSTTTPVVAVKNAVLSPATDQLIGQPAYSSNLRRILCLSSDLQSTTIMLKKIKGGDIHITAELQQAITTETLKKKLRHRERSRINQARYRLRQRRIENDLENAIRQLRSTIEDLEKRCDDFFRLPTTPTCWALASEYFRQFNYFISSPGTLYNMAFKFLHENMAPHVASGSQFGIDAHLQNWKSFAHCFDDASVDLMCLKMPTTNTLVAYTVTTVTITSKTLSVAFPHLTSDSACDAKHSELSPLAARMLDKKLVMRGSVLFDWDSTTGKVSSLRSQADMMTPMLNLLGSLEDVSCAFNKARVTPDCTFEASVV